MSNYTKMYVPVQKRNDRPWKTYMIVALPVLAAVALIVLIPSIVHSVNTRQYAYELERGRMHAMAEEYELAISDYEHAIAIDSKNVTAYLDLSEVYIAVGQYALAQSTLVLAQEQISDDAPTLDPASAYIRKGFALLTLDEKLTRLVGFIENGAVGTLAMTSEGLEFRPIPPEVTTILTENEDGEIIEIETITIPAGAPAE